MRRIRPVPLVAALALGALIANLAPALAGTQAEVTTTRLRIELSTTADWARVRVSGAAFPVVRTLVGDDRDAVTFSGDAWTLVNHTGGATRLVVDTIVTELSGRESFTMILEQARFGSSTASIVDEGRSPDPISTLSTGEAAGGATSSSRSLDRAALLGATELQIPHADPRRLVLAAFYPWFKRSGNPTSQMAEEPLAARSAWDADDVRSQALQARGAGIDGFAFSWAGQHENGPQLDLMLRAMEEQGGTVVPYLETARATGLLGRVDASKIAAWVDEALSRAGSPAFLKAPDGTPVIMVFAMERLGADTWGAIAADSARRGHPVRFVGDADPATHGAVTSGWHRYGASGTAPQLTGLWKTMSQRLRGPRLLDPAAGAGLTVATVSPGYDDTRLRGSQNPVVPRGVDGSRYDETWDAAIAGDPDWILITSWNEWFEGTSVEPGTVTGHLALHQTGVRIAEWKGQPAPAVDLAPAPTTTTPTTAPAPSEAPLLPSLPSPLRAPVEWVGAVPPDLLQRPS